MSSSMKSTSMNCKVCKDAGKSEKEYTSHQPRDRDGKTICPLLLSLNCRKCGKKGHTIKYCKVNTEKQQRVVVVPPVQVVPVKPEIKRGKYDSLVESSDEEEEGEEKESVIQEPIQETLVVVKPTYADKVKKEAHILPLAPTLSSTLVPRLPLAPMLSLAPTLSLAPELSRAPTLSLAPVLSRAPMLSLAPELSRAPALPITEEEKIKIQKLKQDCREIMTKKSSWAEDSDSDEDEDEDEDD